MSFWSNRNEFLRAVFLLPKILASFDWRSSGSTTLSSMRWSGPGRREKRLIFQVLTAKMNLSEDVDLEDYVSRPEKVSGAEIHCIVQEAGMQAVRNNRYAVLPADFAPCQRVTA